MYCMYVLLCTIVPTKDLTDDIFTLSGSNCSPEMTACHHTGCSSIHELRYSDHNTLMVAGVVSSALPQEGLVRTAAASGGAGGAIVNGDGKGGQLNS